MGIRNWLGSTWKGAFLLRRLFAEVRSTRKALERIGDSLDDLLYLQLKQTPGFANLGPKSMRVPEPPQEDGLEFLAQSDEELARLFKLEMAKGGPDVVPLDADLDEADVPGWVPK